MNNSLLFRDPRLPLRFWEKVRVNEASDCWEWTAAIIHGYGYFGVASSVQKRAHRVAYEVLVEAVPDDLQLDHLCRVRHCVNPEHLEPVTCRENLLRGQTLAAVNATKTECIKGHPLGGANLYITPNGRRQCRTCRAAANRAIRARKAAARKAHLSPQTCVGDD